jgi:hypothetical protein
MTRSWMAGLLGQVGSRVCQLAITVSVVVIRHASAGINIFKNIVRPNGSELDCLWSFGIRSCMQESYILVQGINDKASAGSRDG